MRHRIEGEVLGAGSPVNRGTAVGLLLAQGEWGASMPLYMDTHKNVEGLTAEAVAGAHQADLATQEKYGVDYKQYWFNEDEGTVYCLVEAPNAEAAMTVHREAHGLVADDIVEVHEGH